MYPHERSLVKELKDSPFALIGVNSDSPLEKIRKIVKEKNLSWRSFQNTPKDATRSISEAWAVQGWPTLVVLDAEMRIRHRSHDGDQAIALVRQLVKELEAQKK
jgi:hypothetical protein